MRTIKNISLAFFTLIIFAILSVDVPLPTKAETNTITIGSWTFEDNAFADNATDLSTTNKIRVAGVESCEFIQESNFEECLDLALTGYSPDTFLVNVGTALDTESNNFKLDFTDLKATNNFGADLVFFECHLGENSYEIAVHPEGGELTDFVTFDASDFHETDVACLDDMTWGVPIDLSVFGIAPAAVVDAIHFKVVDPDPFDPDVSAEAEPSMAAVLNNPPIALFLPFIKR